MIVKFQTIEDGRLPARATPGAAGLDCCARIGVTIPPRGQMKIPLGFAVEIPHGYHGQIRPRSGLASKGIAAVLGTIDSDYRGELCAILYNHTPDSYQVARGTRVCQLVIVPHEDIELVEAPLNETQRGSGGFGSSGLAPL